MKRENKAIIKALGDDIKLIKFFEACMETNWNTQKAYKLVNPQVTDKTAKLMGWTYMQKLKASNINLVLEAQGLGTNSYFKQLKEGLGATKMEVVAVGVYEERPDHKVRRAYHRAQGVMLGIEKKKDEVINDNRIQINVVKYGDNDPV